MYLGTPGRMVELNCASRLQTQHEERLSFRSTVLGAVKAQGRPLARRTWDLALSGPPTPSEVAALTGFARGHWGKGPFAFISDEAAVTNMLEPSATDLTVYLAGSGSPATPAGPWETVDGWAGNSLIKDTGNGLWFGGRRVPVIPGKPVTASAYVAGTGATVGISWYDADNAHIAHVQGSQTVDGGRSFLTLTPPAGAAQAWVFVNESTMKFTRPALTMTPDLLEYSDGNGCLKALPFGLSRDAVMLLNTPGYGRYSRVNFQMQEVG